MNTLVTQFASEEAGTKTGVAALGIDPKSFIIQLITFLFVFLILRKFVFKPVVNVLKTRQETIEEGVKLTTDLTNQKEELDRKAAAVHKAARKEADAIVADAYAQKTAMIKEAEESAQTKADLILADAQSKIADEKARARRDIEHEMVDLVVQATEAVTREKLDAKKDNALITNALKGQA